jgi:hypothetical protein
MDSSLTKSWTLLDDSESDISVISSSENTSGMSSNTSSIHIESLEPTQSKNYDLYDLDISEVLPILKEKSKSKADDMIARSKLKKSASIATNSNSEVMNMLKSSKENDDIQKALTVLAQKQKRYIEMAKGASKNVEDNTFLTKQPTFNLNNEDASNISDRSTQIEVEQTQAKDQNESIVDLLAKNSDSTVKDCESEKNSNGEKIRKAKIVSPFHGEPSVDLNELLRRNQTDAQIFISQVKEKNKSFIDTVFDY